MTRAKRIEKQINQYKSLEGDTLFGRLAKKLKREWIGSAKRAGFSVIETTDRVRVTAKK